MITAFAPVRVCDLGGWTDTWFGGPGRVVSVAVRPGVEVTIHATAGTDAVDLHVATFGDHYRIVPGATRVPRHPLVEAAVDTYPPPGNIAVALAVRSGVPAGCGTGTSAALAVALVGALASARDERLSPREAAYAAHRLEVDVLGGQSGIQDQLCAAFGGINYLEIDPYPEAVVHALPPWSELGARLTVVFLGRAHHSSEVHLQVIEDRGGEASAAFTRLRSAAVAARGAVLDKDIDAFGGAMIANTEAQRSLHPRLVGEDADRVIGLAAAHDAIGWKVNGAGGDGGSVTVLSASEEAKAALERDVGASTTHYRVLPVAISEAGLHVRGAL